MTVATKKVTGRRQLHFDSFDELSAEVDRLAASPVRCLGNWSFGQICRHVATVMNCSIDGFAFQAAWPIRKVARFFKRRVLNNPMSPGFKFPAFAAKVLLPAEVDDASGVSELRVAIARQQRETHRERNPFFGPLTIEEWRQLHLRHAALHLSFIEPL